MIKPQNVALLAASLIGQAAMAHPGEINANDCHRLGASTPGYHCHGGSAVRVPKLSNDDGDLDCSEFASQLDVQSFYEKNEPRWDPHGLDADCDWIACETNSGPKSDIARIADGEGWLTIAKENRVAGVNACPRVQY